VSVRGAGGDGPDGDKPGYDVMAQARSGLMSVTGTTGPTKVGVAVADVVSGLYAAVGALAGLLAKRPLRVEVGLLEAAVSMLVNQASQRAGRRRGPDASRQRPPEHRAVRAGAVRRPAARGRARQRRAVRRARRAVGLDATPSGDQRRSRRRPRRAEGRAAAGVLAAAGGEWAQVLDGAGRAVRGRAGPRLAARRPAAVANGQLQEVDHPAGRCAWSGRRTGSTSSGRGSAALRRCSGSTLPRCCPPSVSTTRSSGRSPVPTGGEALVAALRALDVEVAFGLPGVHNLAAWKAFPGSGVRLVGVRHEQTAGYAADGWARATGRLGVALTTTGPGAANVVAATGEAWACHSPLLVIATDIPSTVRRPGVFRGVLHETTDQAGFFRPVTKARCGWSGRRSCTSRSCGRAARAAAPRRPVYLEVPTDLLSRRCPEPARCRAAARRSARAARGRRGGRAATARAAAGLGRGGATAPAPARAGALARGSAPRC
jgi:hypothetical protein